MAGTRRRNLSAIEARNCALSNVRRAAEVWLIRESWDCSGYYLGCMRERDA